MSSSIQTNHSFDLSSAQNILFISSTYNNGICSSSLYFLILLSDVTIFLRQTVLFNWYSTSTTYLIGCPIISVQLSFFPEIRLPPLSFKPLFRKIIYMPQIPAIPASKLTTPIIMFLFPNPEPQNEKPQTSISWSQTPYFYNLIYIDKNHIYFSNQTFQKN